MKSPHLYERIREHKIMVVPSPLCLRTYVCKYKGGFGFNEEVLTAVADKACTIDLHHRHDGILVGEMKPSENLTVNSNGHDDGFIDLGRYSDQGKKVFNVTVALQYCFSHSQANVNKFSVHLVREAT